MSQPSTGQPAQIDRYRLVRKIRQVGAYYTVFEAIQKYLERTVELRVLNVRLEEDSPEFLRFAQEFRTVANLNHPNILRILDLGLTADRIYYITDYHGKASSLQSLVDQGREFTLKETLNIGKGMASALVYMHARQVLHRSLTADVIYYDEEADNPYIAEFSLVKNLKMDNLSSVGVPQMAEMLKTPEFMQGLELTDRTDIYCLGNVLYKLLTHHCIKTRPGPPADPEEADRRLHPRTFNTSIPDELDSAIYRCLRPNPADRHASAAALKDALAAAEEKVFIRGGLMKMSGEIHLDSLRGSLEKQHQAVEKAKEQKARASQRVRAIPEGGTEEGAPRRTTRSSQAVVPQSAFARHKSLISMVAVMLAVGGGVGWAVWERVALASMDEPEVITSGIRKGLRQKAPAVVKTYDEDLRKEIAAVKTTPTTVFSFQERWYLLDNWLKQLAREKQQPPFTAPELMKVRQDTYSDQPRANLALDQLFRKADDYLDDNRGKKK